MSAPLYAPLLPVVVGVDGSPAADAALHWALTHAAATGTTVRAVTVLPAPMVGFASFDGFAPFPEADPFDAAVLLERALERVVSDPAQRAAIERRAVVGSPVERLLDEAATAAMLVVGQGGRSRGRRLLSTARQLVARATCPVVVVPHYADRPAPAMPARELATAAHRPEPTTLVGAAR